MWIAEFCTGRLLRFACVLNFLLLPACVQRIPCTQEAFEQALADACPDGNVTIRFNCSDTVIPISDASDRDNRRINCDNVVIDGEDRNITFRLDPPCHDGYADTCPDVENRAWLVRLEGNHGVIRNIKVDAFWEGIHAGGGLGNVVENSEFHYNCDDSFTNRPGAVGTVFRNNTVRNSCDKSLQVYGRPASATTHVSRDADEFFDLSILDNEFIDCRQPIRTTNKGRFLVRGNAFGLRENDSTLFECEGPRFSGKDVAVYFEGNLVESCIHGLRVYGNVHIVARNNVFRRNATRGAAVFGSARALFEFNLFESNGGSESEDRLYGGLVVADSAKVDAGGGSLSLDGVGQTSQGRNEFRDNRDPFDAALDLSNMTAEIVFAQRNSWGERDPSDQVDGPVDLHPIRSGNGHASVGESR